MLNCLVPLQECTFLARALHKVRESATQFHNPATLLERIYIFIGRLSRTIFL